MGNLRNVDGYKNSFWDWTFLNAAFYPTKIRVSDIDGIVERNGKFLFIETKRPNEKIGEGQNILHNRLVETGVFCILIIIGDPNKPISYTLTTSQAILKYDSPIANLEHLTSVVKKWFDWANNI